jgi:hypothetical protein
MPMPVAPPAPTLPAGASYIKPGSNLTMDNFIVNTSGMQGSTYKVIVQSMRPAMVAAKDVYKAYFYYGFVFVKATDNKYYTANSGVFLPIDEQTIKNKFGFNPFDYNLNGLDGIGTIGTIAISSGLAALATYILRGNNTTVAAQPDPQTNPAPTIELPAGAKYLKPQSIEHISATLIVNAGPKEGSAYKVSVVSGKTIQERFAVAAFVHKGFVFIKTTDNKLFFANSGVFLPIDEAQVIKAFDGINPFDQPLGELAVAIAAIAAVLTALGTIISHLVKLRKVKSPSECFDNEPPEPTGNEKIDKAQQEEYQYYLAACQAVATGQQVNTAFQENKSTVDKLREMINPGSTSTNATGAGANNAVGVPGSNDNKPTQAGFPWVLLLAGTVVGGIVYNVVTNNKDARDEKKDNKPDNKADNSKPVNGLSGVKKPKTKPKKVKARTGKRELVKVVQF